MKLDRDFFTQDTRVVAQELLGKVLVIGTHSLIVTETEAYLGEEDLASHARFGRTKRSEIMWRIGGHVYVYLIYGIHEMINIVSGNVDEPGAVLLRAGITRSGEKIVGPGKLTHYLGITRVMNDIDCVTSPSFYFDNNETYKGKIVATPRIGVKYAGAWAVKKYRYILTA